MIGKVARFVLIVGLVAFVLISEASAAQFTDLATALNISGAIGAAWGDYNDDGYPDLILAGSVTGHWPMLLQNNGNLTFTDVSDLLGFPTISDEQDGIAWADYDNDGDFDVIIACGSGSVKLYRNDETTFTEVGTTAGMGAAAGPGRGVAWCDYDTDGWLDVFICNTMANVSHLMHNEGDGTFSDATESAGMTGLALPSSGNTASWSDFNNDGNADLMLSRMGLRPLLYRNNGDGTFIEVGLTAGLSVVSDTYGVAWADYDNDGWMDCYLGSATTINDWLLHNNGDGTFTNVAATAGMANDINVGVGVAWADYDNDSWIDLYVGNINTGNEPFLYHNNGNGTFTETATSAGVGGSRPNEAACWADIDLDGRMDLLSAVGGPLSSLFHNIGFTGNWLRVSILTSGNGDATAADVPTRDAIGARVDLNLDNDDSFVAGRTLARFIDGGSGFCGQNEQVAHFGIGSASLVAVRIRFPDGSVVVHRNVAANQQITIRDVPADRVEIFDDVPLDYWAYTYVKSVVDASIASGYPDGTYAPTNPVTRDQMAVFISRAMAEGDANVPTGPATATFTDVPNTGYGQDGTQPYWAYKYIEYAAANDVVRGYPEGDYKPTLALDRGQMAVFIARAIVTPTGEAGMVNYIPPTNPTFPDVTSSNDWSWAYKYVEYIAAANVTQGYPDGQYHPETGCTRDQMAVYIQRAFQLPM